MRRRASGRFGVFAVEAFVIAGRVLQSEVVIPARLVISDPAGILKSGDGTGNGEVGPSGMDRIYRQLLLVCGSATNAFLNLSRSAGLESRRLLLLTPDHRAKHVVAEVLVEGRWIVVDPSFRIVMRDGSGRALTRKDLQDIQKLREATISALNYPAEYSYDRYAHVRLARLPLDGFHLRKLLESTLPGWDETLDWSLFLERESHFAFVITTASAFLLLTLRLLLAWYADRRLFVSRFHFRQHLLRATSAFLTTLEIQ